MFIVDSQVHIWAPDTPERPWVVGRKPHRATPLTAPELLAKMDAAGVARAVLMPPSWDGDRNDLVLAAARTHPDRFAVMGRLDIAAPGARESIRVWRQQPGMLGLRVSFSLPEFAPALLEDRVDWLWEEAEKAGVPITLMVTQAMIPRIDRAAARYPHLKLMLCHLALPTGERDDAALRDFEKLLPIAKRPNVAVKASALPAYTSDVYPYRALHSYLRRVYDAFGPRRIFWGTDLARLPCGYEPAINLFTQEIPWLTAEDKEWIMGRGLCEWTGWQVCS